MALAVTIRDIAKRLGVSHATVSRALNHKEDPFISEATRRRVIEASREMGYRTNLSARALITGKTSNMGLLVESVEEWTGPHFTEMLKAVEPKARSLGYRLGVFGEPESILGEAIVDGLVALTSPENPRLKLLRDEIPVVFVYPGSSLAARTVSWSDCEGACNGVKQLLILGHSSVAAIFGDLRPENASGNPKVAGFRQAIQDAGADSTELFGTRSPDQFENGYLLTRELLREGAKATAFFARNDFIALGAIKALREAGMRVPDDVSVVGYNDTVLARCSDPGLTSVRTPIAQAGEMAVERLAKAIESGEADFPGIMLPTSLTVRDSCAPPKS